MESSRPDSTEAQKRLFGDVSEVETPSSTTDSSSDPSTTTGGVTSATSREAIPAEEKEASKENIFQPQNTDGTSASNSKDVR